MAAVLWTDKFFPETLEGFVGNFEIAGKAMEWARKWNKGTKQAPLLFFGPTGTGKTCLAYLIARLNKWPVFELNASDFRSKDIIERLVGAAALNSSFSGEKRLVLLDEIDGLQARDRGGAGAILQIMKQTQNPVILTANDIYSNQKLSSIRFSAETMQFKKINYLSIAKRLKEILEKERVPFEQEAVKELAKNSSGDFRSALLDLQTLSGEKITMDSVKALGFRERQENIFKVLEDTFKAKTFTESRTPRLKSDLSIDLLKNWIDENIPRHFTDPKDTASAFERFSRADIFDGRIRRRQHWGFLRYSADLMTAGVSLSKSREYGGWIKYQFPGLLSRLSKSKGTRAMKKGIAEKMKKKIHSSVRGIIAEDFPFYFILFKHKEAAAKLSALFDLNEEEIAFLMESNAKTKKVQNVFREAQEIGRNLLKEKQATFFGERVALKESKKEPDETKELPEENSQTSLSGFT